ncbi:hypothetical protein KP79_PYT11288 [Mizuhopecten yessoensis]|uniref:Uncharacterized protein n=1 Tax=Mizuhopecten yessoensis TaxID=6573 RepID=A0A210Q980_MIZYE|nr:hypothetical protein KP79_PYT11288 [Mizuhopecten yessoensis]
MKFLETCILALMLITQHILADGPDEPKDDSFLKTALRLSVNHLNTPEEDFPSPAETRSIKYGFPDVVRSLKPHALEHAFGLNNLKAAIRNYQTGQLGSEFTDTYPDNGRIEFTKKWAEFLGKRSNKRWAEFIGKRFGEYLGKRSGEWLG